MAKTKVANTNLHDAKKNKKDEFYTQLSDIENELQHYKEHFKDKIVYCNCDDPLQSAFFEYFFKNFKWLDLKALITTCYKSQNYREVSAEDSPKKAYAIKICKSDEINNKPIDPQMHSIKDVEAVLSLSLSKRKKQSQETLDAFDKNKHKLFENFRAELKSDPSLFPLDEDKGLNNAGDFRSKDCIELLKIADIVVTNPPFSLFREYIAQLVKYDKKFLIIGNVNAITYKDTFELIKDNKLWLGVSITSGDRKFYVPDYTPLNAAGCGVEKVMQNGKEVERKFIRVKGVRWFTNLTHKKRNEPLETIASYKKNPEKYPKYDNYDAINVDKTIEIPLDYDGVMGVPITFLDKHNPKQFEILSCHEPAILLETLRQIPKFKEYKSRQIVINGRVCQKTYHRIFIRKIAEADDLRKQEQEK